MGLCVSVIISHLPRISLFTRLIKVNVRARMCVGSPARPPVLSLSILSLSGMFAVVFRLHQGE